VKLVHAVVECSECGWRSESLNAMGSGAVHNRRTGHEVIVELGYAHIYPKRVPERKIGRKIE